MRPLVIVVRIVVRQVILEINPLLNIYIGVEFDGGGLRQQKQHEKYLELISRLHMKKWNIALSMKSYNNYDHLEQWPAKKVKILHTP